MVRPLLNETSFRRRIDAKEEVIHAEDQQEEILKVMEAHYGWRVRPVDIKAAPSLAERFGVERVPYLLLVYRRTGKHIPVAFGVVALDTLTRNIYQGIRYLEGRVTPEQFNLYGPDEGGSKTSHCSLGFDRKPFRDE